MKISLMGLIYSFMNDKSLVNCLFKTINILINLQKNKYFGMPLKSLP